MFDWSGKNGNKSGKRQGILISCEWHCCLMNSHMTLSHHHLKIIYERDSNFNLKYIQENRTAINPPCSNTCQ